MSKGREVGDVCSGVMIGKDSYLFLADGGHQVLEYATGRAAVSDTSLCNFDKNIRWRHDCCREIEAKYLHVIIPDKQSVLEEKIPVVIRNRLGDIYMKYVNLNDVTMYPIDFLKSLAPCPYLRTDTHLTNSGSIAVAVHIAEQLTGKHLSNERARLQENLEALPNFIGDLGSKLEPKVAETAVVYRGKIGDKWLHNNLIDGNNGVVDLRWNEAATVQARLLLFGDSFGRDLAWFLSHFFREVLFLRTPHLHREVMQQIRPNFVVTECVERYLDVCSSDDNRPEFLLYPYFSGKNYAPSKEFAEAFSSMLSFPRSPYWRFRESPSQ